MENIKEINLKSTEADILKFCQEVPEAGKGSEVRQMYLDYAVGLLNIKQQEKLVREQEKSNKNLLIVNWILAVGTIIFGTFSAYTSSVQIQNNIRQVSASLMFQISNDMRNEENSPLVYGIATEQKPLLEVNGGKFKEETLDNYLTKYELLYAAYKNNIISRDMITTAFGYDLTMASKNEEIKEFIVDVRNENKDNSVYRGFSELARLVNQKY